MLASVAALAVSIGACGGGGDQAETSGRAGSPAPELTKAQFIKQADAACEQQNEELSAAFAEFAESHVIKGGELSKTQREEFSGKVFFPYVEKRIQILRQENPPEADVEQVEAIVAATKAGLARARRNLSQSLTPQTHDPLAGAESMSRKFGLEICGET